MRNLFAMFMLCSVLTASTTFAQTVDDFPDVKTAVPGQTSITDPEVLVVVATDRRTIAAYSSVTSSWDKIRLPRPLREDENPVITPKFASIMIDNEAYAISSKMCRWIKLQLPRGNKAYLGSWPTNMVFVSDRERVYVLGENAKRWKSFNAKTREIDDR